MIHKLTVNINPDYFIVVCANFANKQSKGEPPNEEGIASNRSGWTDIGLRANCPVQFQIR